MAVDVTNFETEVLVPSRDTPVLVDFWAPWCGPCKMLTPILEKLESEADGRWILAKVNTEEQQELAMRFEVSSIPDVRLFHDEKEIDSFLGQLPATEIKGWLEKTLPSPHKETLKEARVALNEDDTKTAAQKAEIVLDAEPDNNEARVVLAEAQLRDDATAALKTLEPILEGHPNTLNGTVLPRGFNRDDVRYNSVRPKPVSEFLTDKLWTCVRNKRHRGTCPTHPHLFDCFDHRQRRLCGDVSSDVETGGTVHHVHCPSGKTATLNQIHQVDVDHITKMSCTGQTGGPPRRLML